MLGVRFPAGPELVKGALAAGSRPDGAWAAGPQGFVHGMDAGATVNAM